LADAGFTGIVDVFESPYGGFCTTFSRSQDRFDLAQLTAGLGERFETMNVALKFYACVGSNHTALDGLREIQARRPFGPDEVDRIVIHGSQATVDHVGWAYSPQSLTTAQMNLPFCVATLLVAGDVFVDQFDESAVGDPRRIALANKVEVRHDPAITARGARFRHMVRIELHLADGTRHEETVEAPRGSEQRFAGESEVVAKFAKLSRGVLSKAQADRVADLVLDCDKLEDIGLLTRALVPRP
jgi:2-methylcitrate dehydratase PrpD